MKYPRRKYLGVSGLSKWNNYTRVTKVHETETGVQVDVTHGETYPRLSAGRTRAIAAWVRQRLIETRGLTVDFPVSDVRAKGHETQVTFGTFA